MLSLAFRHAKPYRIHPTVVVSMLNFYSRRPTDVYHRDLFVGIVLGVELETHIELMNCYPVKLCRPKNRGRKVVVEEDDEDGDGNRGRATGNGVDVLDDTTVAIDLKLFERFFKLYRRLYPTHYVMGWFVLQPEVDLNPSFFSVLSEVTERHVCTSPVIVAMDPFVGTGIRAWVSTRHAFSSASISPVAAPAETTSSVPPPAAETDADTETTAAAAPAPDAPKVTAATIAASTVPEPSASPSSTESVSTVSSVRRLGARAVFARTFLQVPICHTTTDAEVSALSLLRRVGSERPLSTDSALLRTQQSLTDLREMVTDLASDEDDSEEAISQREWLFSQIRELQVIDPDVFEGFAMDDKVRRLLTLTYLAKVAKSLGVTKEKVLPRKNLSQGGERGGGGGENRHHHRSDQHQHQHHQQRHQRQGDSRRTKRVHWQN